MNYDALLRKGYRTFSTPYEFLSACVEYFKWAEETPLLEELVDIRGGEVFREEKSKCRAFTKQGLCTYLGIPASRIDSYRKKEGWGEAVEMVEQAIYAQKFENAAAGLLNAGIITRDLGLAEKQEIGGTAGGAPVSFNINPVKAGTYLPSEDEPVTE